MSARRLVVRALFVLSLVAAPVIWGAGPVFASCHAFTVSASPSSVTEGGKVTVTVTRDGNYAPSSINLSTVDGTAKKNTDYVPLNMRVEFVSDVSQSFKLSTINDSVHESTETLKLHLSDPQGCFGSGYVVGPDATVTILDNDAAPSHSPTPTAKATAEPKTRLASGVPTTSAKPSPRASSTPTKTKKASSPSPTASVLAVGPTAARRGSSTGPIIGVVFGVLALLGAGMLVMRRRARARTLP